MAKVNYRNDVTWAISDKEKKLLDTIQTRFRASWMHKDFLGLHSLWGKCDDYWCGDVNKPEDEDDPGSNTNIIQPIIESQIADLVDGTMEVFLKGVGPSDRPFAKDTSDLIKWVWKRNKMIPKMDDAERNRLNLGTVGWKVWYDWDAMKGRGLPVMEPCSPDSLFPDPKIKDPYKIQEGDFFIHVMPYPTSWFRRRFGKRGQLVQPEGKFGPYFPFINQEDFDDAAEVVRDQALLYEYWEKDDDGKLRRVYCTKDVILEDSDWDSFDEEKGGRESFYKHAKFPFVIIPCYKKKGRLWGMSDTEQLIPVQDMINDFDDQIRMNARLMGNIQIVVGLASGINVKKWTNKPGLKIPAKDHTAWQTVQPTTMPGYILQRRDAGFRESEIVSGRSDVLEGRRSGSLRAASAILALQEAGSRRANHKKLMLQEGFVEVIELLLDYIKEFMTEEMAVEITEKGKTDYKWLRGSDLQKVPWLTPNENWFEGAEGIEPYKQLYDFATDDQGQFVPDDLGNPTVEAITKEAEFDIEVSFGAGMPNNKSFLYQACIELNREGLITREEGRATLKELLNWPIIDPMNPVGTFNARNMSPEQLAIANGMPPEGVMPPGQPPVEQPPVQPGIQQDPATLQALQMIQALPPEVLQQLLGGIAV